MKKTAKKAAKSKNLGGRPKLPEGKVRNQRLDVRFTLGEIAELKERASQSGESWAAWVRQRLGV